MKPEKKLEAEKTTKKTAEEVVEFTRRECGADLCYACYKAWKAEGMA